MKNEQKKFLSALGLKSDRVSMVLLLFLQKYQMKNVKKAEMKWQFIFVFFG